MKDKLKNSNSTLNMLKKLVGLSLIFASLQTVAQEHKVKFAGEVDPQFNGTRIYIFNSNTSKRDTVFVKEGKWAAEVDYSEPSRYLLTAEAEINKHKSYGPFGILVDEPSQVLIKGDLEAFNTSDVKGSKPQQQLNAYNQKIEHQAEAILAKLSKNHKIDVESFIYDSSKKEEQHVAVREEYNQLITEAIHNAIAEQVKTYPSSLTSSFLLARYNEDMSPELIAELYEELSAAMKETRFGINIKKSIKTAAQSQVGSEVPNFTLEDDQGNNVSFASFKGSYVFIDFWASWCGPCIAEFANLKKTHTKYVDNDKFKIIGISTDKTQAVWKRTLANHKLPWLQLIDAQGKASVSENQLHVKSLPTTFLIDPDGKIIAKDLRGEALDAFLKTIL